MINSARTPDEIDTEMLYACRDGDYGRALAALEEGGFIDVKDRNGDTMLTMLADRNRPDAHRMVRTLLDAGADWSVSSSEGWRPFEIACDCGNLQAVREFLAAGINPNIGDITGVVPLQWAAWHAHFEVMQALLEAGANPNGLATKDLHRSTPLHNATGRGVVEFLIAHGADPSLYSDEGYLPIHTAIAKGKVDVVQAFLDAGVDVDSPVSWARGSSSGLMLAAASGNLEMVEFLLSKGADLNQVDNHDKTALHHACSSGRSEVAIYLIDNGLACALNMQDAKRVRPMEYEQAGEVRQIMASRDAAGAIEDAFAQMPSSSSSLLKRRPGLSL